MREEVLEEGCLGWIFGSLGAGKSCTAMAFASTLDRNEWILTWIHVKVSFASSWLCVRLEGDERKTRRFQICEMNEVLHNESGKKYLVLLDGGPQHH